MATTPEYVRKELDKRTNLLVEDCITLRTKILNGNLSVQKQINDITKTIEMIGYDVDVLK